MLMYMEYNFDDKIAISYKKYKILTCVILRNENGVVRKRDEWRKVW